MNVTHYGLIYAGFSSIALGILHIPRIWSSVFRQWNEELNNSGLLTRKLINTVLVALCLSVAALGSLTLLIAAEGPVFDGIHVWVLFFCFLFWLWRFAWQIFYFPYRKLKPGPYLLSLHVFLIVIFAANTLAYIIPVITTFMQ